MLNLVQCSACHGLSPLACSYVDQLHSKEHVVGTVLAPGEGTESESTTSPPWRSGFQWFRWLGTPSLV